MLLQSVCVLPRLSKKVFDGRVLLRLAADGFHDQVVVSTLAHIALAAQTNVALGAWLTQTVGFGRLVLGEEVGVSTAGRSVLHRDVHARAVLGH